MKKILCLSIFVLFLSSCGSSHLYDAARTSAVVNANYDVIGEYAYIEADSPDVTVEALEDVFYNYYEKKNLNYLVVVYNDLPGQGVYMIGNMVAVGVEIVLDKNADYMCGDIGDATLYTPQDGKLVK